MTDQQPAEPIAIDSAHYQGPDRRHEMRVWRAAVDQRLDDGSATMKALRTELEKNTESTERIEADTSELVSLLQSFKGAFKVLDMVGKAAKPLSMVVSLCMGLWGLISIVKGGGSGHGGAS